MIFSRDNSIEFFPSTINFKNDIFENPPFNNSAKSHFSAAKQHTLQDINNDITNDTFFSDIHRIYTIIN